MKTTKILLGALALFSLAACSDDKDAGAPENKSTAKIRVNIVSNPGSRTDSDDFEDGVGDENTIKSISLVFYDANKNPMGGRVDVTEANIKDGTLVESPNVEKVKTLEAEVTLQDGRYPSYMMVYANPIDNSTLASQPISAIRSETREVYKTTQGFTMNNAVYYSSNTSSGVVQREVPVSQANFYQTEEEKATAEEVIVYLERMAGKVTLQSANGDPSQITEKQTGTLDGKTLEFTVTGWGINAEAKEMYLSKIFQNKNGAVRSWTDMNTSFGSFEWNEPSKHRSYWAFTPYYWLDNNKVGEGLFVYPWVSDQVGTKNNLNYNKFTELAKGKVGESAYTLENTISSDLYSDGNINVNSALVSAVVTGVYTLNGTAVTFYVHGNKIYTESDYITAMVKLSNIIVHEDGSALTDADAAALPNIFKITHPTKPIGTDPDKGVEENKVCISVTVASATGYKYKAAGSTEAVAITNTNVATVNSDLQALTGLASMYKDGKAYFNVPIRHLAPEPTGNNTWGPGSFGVVRNHHYVITVDGFAELSFDTLGKGVRDPEDPVVPPSDPNEKFGIKAQVRVLAWRLVPQNVTLGEKK